jgi:hypothetical protein
MLKKGWRVEWERVGIESYGEEESSLVVVGLGAIGLCGHDDDVREM